MWVACLLYLWFVGCTETHMQTRQNCDRIQHKTTAYIVSTSSLLNFLSSWYITWGLLEEGTSIKKMTQLDWSVGKSVFNRFAARNWRVCGMSQQCFSMKLRAVLRCGIVPFISVLINLSKLVQISVFHFICKMTLIKGLPIKVLQILSELI